MQLPTASMATMCTVTARGTEWLAKFFVGLVIPRSRIQYMKWPAGRFQEAEMAVAPLTVNFRRSEVVSFTKPFLSLGISILYKVWHFPSIQFVMLWLIDVSLRVSASFTRCSSTTKLWTITLSQLLYLCSFLPSRAVQKAIFENLNPNDNRNGR